MTAKRLKRLRDPVELGKLIGDILTGQVEDAAVRAWNPRKATLMIEPHIKAAWSQLDRLGWLPGATGHIASV